ncbi:unnamed protein product [Kuraishia capsulata CBS 1993]|uniref:Sugar phosphate transporter domain-containing protein n=1 Tax=Kuraishia capsulata CBS 1993 TaxID=1382522 RepID=W6MSL9_9ASCO|nr:uncharacterized protein KUCA_T00005366001 [Kuraishia capsulata CBS 1993]CDK29378.1 unnamed protein product [Kuraishia capsulata CBS 1993]
MSGMLYLKQTRLQRPIERVSGLFERYTRILPVIDWKLVFLCSIWYSTSVVSNNSTKSILREFSYPVTLTEIQFLLNAAFCLLTVCAVRSYDRAFNTRRTNPNSLYAARPRSIVDIFPTGTFPANLDSQSYSILHDFTKPTRFVLMTTLPMGIFQFVGHIASHKATSIIPVSLVHTIKALSPITTVVIYRSLFKVEFSTKTYLTLVPLVSGVMLSCLKNNLAINDDLFYKGIMFAFLSMLIFVSQNIFAKRILTFEAKPNSGDFFSEAAKSLSLSQNQTFRSNLKVVRSESAASTPILPISMTPAQMSPQLSARPERIPLQTDKSSLNLSNHFQQTEKKLDKVTVLFYCSLVGFGLTLPIYIMSEVSNSKSNAFSLSLVGTPMMWTMLINGSSHFAQSLVAFQILGMISPINYSIANIMKRICVIVGSILVEGTSLTNIQWLGLVLTVAGLYAYDKWGVQRK